MGQTAMQKILAAHAGKKEVKTGEFIMAKVDLAMANDVTAPISIKALERAGITRLWNKDRIAIVLSHFVPAKDALSAAQAAVAREFCQKYDISLFFDEGRGGIEHSLLPELGLVVPGDVVIGADSHSCTYGGLGLFSTGVGSTDLAAVMATGECWLKVPETMKFTYHGKPGPWVTGKDLVLYTIGQIGVDGALYRNMEFTGDSLKHLSMEARLTITNMVIEAGGKSGFIEADEVTEAYLKGRAQRPCTIYKSDPDAAYCVKHEWDISGMEPQVAKPNLPDKVVGVSEVLGAKVHSAFLGSCTNGRIEDLRVAAQIIKGRKVAKGLRFMVIPATQNIYRQALKEGLIDIFMDAEAVVSAATCGPCLGGHMGVLGPDEVCISSSNRNFPGRMGHRDSQVYLANPAVVTASAVAGRLAHPEEILGKNVIPAAA
ncbi:MAG: 3-isopropylmalate dehydratase large subunit [Elusimicrobia bacterium RIFCSPLOWO2_01_FULL_59_12]|nr:MAG: 3-isopropylmalate dehydratase large subunit [Elusimicrobia bacterium RIFCSPLOWO2_01_FULL_59_12]